VVVPILEPPTEKCQTTSDHLSGPDYEDGSGIALERDQRKCNSG